MFKKILIADDEFLTRWSLKEALSQEGYDVIVVEDGRRAIEKIKEENFDLIIIDLFMPELNGWGVLKEVKKIKPSIPVIIISAYGKEDTETRVKEQGAWEYIEKPYLIERIKKLLKSPGCQNPNKN